MRELLTEEVYFSLKRTVEEGEPLDPAIAPAVANAMKKWAISKGATHFTHWFQPLTDLTAEKHEAFLCPAKEGPILRLTGKDLIVGEPDASSFPSDGMRRTCAARGYTAWDPTSPAFLKEKTLCIPAVFLSYTGETLDKKGPLLRSAAALDRALKRILKLFGTPCRRVVTTVGPEQEYFLIDEEVYLKRRDLLLTGRTLLGAPALRGQELEDHYFGALKSRVLEYMHDLDETLWSYGIYAHSEHNEVAPAQHELAPVFTVTNLASDNNQLMMELMQKVAARHRLVCLLHEKPFAGINGSGKHNNWSLSTDTGENLLDPADDPQSPRFLLLIACILAAVDEHQGILRASVASAGNDRRLGGDEAPPAILSVYLGDQLGAIFDSIVLGREYMPQNPAPGSVGVPESPIFPIDATDRNRTSPFAFTGNKFEFRMPGAKCSVADPNIVLNTIAADAFSRAADALEGEKDFLPACKKYTEELFKKHARIVFNYNGYGPDWAEEAKKRGLLNLRTTADAVPQFFRRESVDVFVRQGVLTEKELIARADIALEKYCKTVRIEALTLADMLRRDVFPTVEGYVRELLETASLKRQISENCADMCEILLAEELSSMNGELLKGAEELEALLARCPTEPAAAETFAKTVLPAMERLRSLADAMERRCPSDRWPFPSYTALLYSVR